MKPPILLSFALLAAFGSTALGQPQEPATGAIQAAPQWPAFPDIGPTDRMDPAVLALLDSLKAKVVEAQSKGEGDAQKAAVGLAFGELGLAFEANTMSTPAQECFAAAYRIIPGEGPSRSQWLFRRGVAEYAMGDLYTARDTFAAVSEMLKGTPVVQARYGTTLMDLGEFDAALAAWQRAIDAERIAWEKADPNTRSEAPLAYPESRVGLANAHFALNQLARAETLLLDALKLQSPFPHASYLLGQIYAEQGRDEEAEFHLTLGRGAYPSLPPDPHFMRLAEMRVGYSNRMMQAENLLQAGKYTDAEQLLAGLLTDHPNDHLTLNLMARTQMFMGRRDKVLEFLGRSEIAHPTYHRTKIELVITYLNWAAQSQTLEERAERLAMAKTKCEEGIRIAPQLGIPYYYRGLIELNMINQDDPNAPQAMQTALAYLNRAHELGCQEPQLYERLAMLYAQMDRKRDMLAFAHEVAKRSPEKPGSWMFLAKALWTNQDGEGAMTAARRAQVVSGNDPEVQNFVTRLGEAIQQASK